MAAYEDTAFASHGARAEAQLLSGGLSSEDRAQLDETLLGLSLFFGLVGAAVAIGGFALEAPEFAMGAFLGLAASGAFAFCRSALRSAARPAPVLDLETEIQRRRDGRDIRKAA